jgi:O-methyltransferase domain
VPLDWTDENCARILKNCWRVMPTGKLLVVEPIIRPGGKEAIPAELLDLLMLINSAGRECTAEEIASLLEATGFRLTQIVSTEAPY